jgi:hypothetical protein
LEETNVNRGAESTNSVSFPDFGWKISGPDSSFALAGLRQKEEFIRQGILFLRVVLPKW